jgi:hypothetical protein
MRPWIACLGLALASAAQAASPSPPNAAQVLRECANAATSPQDCPGLEQAVTELGFADQLGKDWHSSINHRTLSDLVRLTEHYQGEPSGTAPRVAGLPEILRTLQVHDVQRPSLWARFKAWLLDWLQQPLRQDTGWLRSLLAHLKVPQLLAQAIGYAMIAALLALTVWIVLRELKAAGVLPRERKRKTEGHTGQSAMVLTTAEGAAPDLASLPLWQQPAALLAMLVQVLRQSGRLGLERALTHRELAQRGRFDDGTQHARFRRIALLAERELYGARPHAAADAPDTELTQALADGISLHAQLRSARGADR